MNTLENISLVFCIPFVGMLLSIAVLPLIAGEWWEKNKKYMVILWSVLFLIPFAVTYSAGTMTEVLADIMINDYIPFIVLLFGLFCVSGNISIQGRFRGSPRANVMLLLIGTLMASWIGTTGASMVMIRPIIRANSWRRRKVQVVIFFIFLVSNIGGCLTPVGDPPLLMGFMRGVPFFWSLHLLPIMLLNTGILLSVFFLLDLRAYRKDISEGLAPEIRDINEKMSIQGVHNIIFLIAIVAAVILSGILGTVPAFSGEIQILGEVSLGIPAIIEIVIILTAAFLSMKTTNKKVRIQNHFSWDAIQEVAVLFIGIFITMEPALLFLEAHGPELGISQPWQMFWATGALSSFLDNTPTYLVFLTTAGTLGASSGIATTVGTIMPVMLMAISCGAVCMGANTYIGNAPNFMVRSIAEGAGIKMPSFFGYMAWSVSFLIPVFIIDMLVFFL
ncbi:Citrate transporter [uncultured Roseburia sp.]|uniref:Sodium:proton antiporter n=1 Tax=Brotonthovivens ammoniilytica TaxID=2981725 RepID=A0ABT2TJ62_9FIRM|nr:sodium:proton antiporter [Brotonthovivens ammoniilytica]MCU6761672.1 sodium:proton antiporter [Brotonthovivens ammoniilytica]SCI43130.1 Citrate transporter [uncultured Roseburia sp.]